MIKAPESCLPQTNIPSLTLRAVKDGAWTPRRKVEQVDCAKCAQIHQWPAQAGFLLPLLLFFLLVFFLSSSLTRAVLGDSAGSQPVVRDHWSISLPVNPSEGPKQERLPLPSPPPFSSPPPPHPGSRVLWQEANCCQRHDSPQKAMRPLRWQNYCQRCEQWVVCFCCSHRPPEWQCVCICEGMCCIGFKH